MDEHATRERHKTHHAMMQFVQWQCAAILCIWQLALICVYIVFFIDI